MIRIGVNGAAGRMGQAILQALPSFSETTISAAYVHAHSSELGKPIAPGADVCYTDSASMDVQGFDVLIDFSVVTSVLQAIKCCCEAKKPMVIGVTGFSDKDHADIKKAATEIPVLLAPNMSLGTNVCFQLIEQLTRTLSNLCSDQMSVEIDIVDYHHRHKVDAPSGTALKMGHIIAKQLQLDPKKALVTEVQSMPVPRPTDRIGVHSVRAGDTVGEHSVSFALNGERIEITHRSSSRLAYANGSIYAAVQLHHKEPGLYDMQTIVNTT